ncbi:basic proline-rich protein-like protein [Lates japonicus]|uniref:Basic proline-rich protein-like protein n=1 Tax=Lates japonicus TaxID=270547 RepID=A0AAD3ML76_LATJO|nr:basic proline-rich protein-like protein [Lates japonicus]
MPPPEKTSAPGTPRKVPCLCTPRKVPQPWYSQGWLWCPWWSLWEGLGFRWAYAWAEAPFSAWSRHPSDGAVLGLFFFFFTQPKSRRPGTRWEQHQVLHKHAVRRMRAITIRQSDPSPFYLTALPHRPSRPSANRDPLPRVYCLSRSPPATVPERPAGRAPDASESSLGSPHHRARLESSFSTGLLPIDSAKPVPLAVVSLDILSQPLCQAEATGAANGPSGRRAGRFMRKGPRCHQSRRHRPATVPPPPAHAGAGRHDGPWRGGPRPRPRRRGGRRGDRLPSRGSSPAPSHPSPTTPAPRANLSRSYGSDLPTPYPLFQHARGSPGDLLRIYG